VFTRGAYRVSIRADGAGAELYRASFEPRGVVPVRVTGGASKLTLRRPTSAAVRVRTQRGVSKLVVDDQRFGAIGSKTWLGSAGSEQAGDRYELEIGGGASELTVAEAPESSLRPMS
jgi:hypothetical protein